METLQKIFTFGDENSFGCCKLGMAAVAPPCAPLLLPAYSDGKLFRSSSGARLLFLVGLKLLLTLGVLLLPEEFLLLLFSNGDASLPLLLFKRCGETAAFFIGISLHRFFGCFGLTHSLRSIGGTKFISGPW